MAEQHDERGERDPSRLDRIAHAATPITYSSYIGGVLIPETDAMSFTPGAAAVGVDQARELLAGQSISSERRQNQIEVKSRASRRLARFA